MCISHTILIQSTQPLVTRYGSGDPCKLNTPPFGCFHLKMIMSAAHCYHSLKLASALTLHLDMPAVNRTYAVSGWGI